MPYNGFTINLRNGPQRPGNQEDSLSPAAPAAPSGFRTMLETGSFLALAAAAAYAGSGFVALSSLSKRGGKTPAWLIALILAALVCHSAAVSQQIFRPEEILFGFGPAMSAAMLFASMLLMIGACFHRIGPVFGITLFVTAAASLLPGAFPGEAMDAALWTPLFRLHLAFALITYGLLGVDIVQAVVMQIQNARFKSLADPIPQHGILSTLPSILTMEKVFFGILWGAFAALTALVLTSFFVTQEATGAWLQLSHKTFLSWASWACLAVLLAGRTLLGWRGKTALKWFWTLCAVYVVAYLGYSFVIEAFL